MSKHYVHKYKDTHAIRRNTFMSMVKAGKAKIIERGKVYWLVETIEFNYKVSRRGIVHKLEQKNDRSHENAIL